MKRLYRLILGSAVALLLAAAAQAQVLNLTGVASAVTSASPGDSVVFTITVENAATVGDYAGGTGNFTLSLTSNTASTITFAAVNAAIPAIAAGSTGTIQVSRTIPLSTSQAATYFINASVAGVTNLGGGSVAVSSISTASPSFTIIGKPDLEITSLTYPAGTAYVGGDIISMSLTWTNRVATNGSNNVPYVPNRNGNSNFFRIEVILSSNPTFGDADDFLLTSHDIASTENADGLTRTINWNQLLPGNFAGTYYVMAKIDALSGVSETVDNDLTDNGNNTWYTETNATRISLLPTNFPTIYWASTSGNSYSDNPSISADGRYTAFASDSTNLVTASSTGGADSNAARDIFIYDNQNSTIRRLSLSQQAAQANAGSANPSISGNGRYVAFSSDATNLILGDVNGFSDIFIVDTVTGTISLQSISTAGIQANGSSFKPSVSHTGRYLVFESSATNLVGTTAVGVTHIYLRNRDVSNSGTFDTPGNTSTTLISQSTGSVAGNGNSIQAAISGDGNYVVFASDASNLVGADAGGFRDIFLRDIAGGTTTLVSRSTAAVQGNAASRAPSINRNPGVSAGFSADGRYIVYGSEATNLVAGDTNLVSDIFVFDRVAVTTTRISVSSTGVEATDPSAVGFRLGSINPSISSTGRYVTFASLANNLATGDSSGQTAVTPIDSNGAVDVFVHDRDADADDVFDEVAVGDRATTIVSKNRFGYQTQGLLGTPSTAASDIYPVISADGRWVALPSDAENTAGLVHGATNRTSPDSNTFRDVFVHDRRINALPGPGTPPTVTITSPGNGSAALVSSPVSLTASATAAVGVISNVQFFVNGTLLGTSSVFPYATSWTPTAVGTYTLSALTTDSFGNQAVSSNITVTINAAPSVGVTSPVANSTLAVNVAQTITATASATTPNATINSIEFFVNGVSLGSDATIVAPFTQTRSGTMSWTPTSSGSFSLTVVATDSLGTRTTSPAIGVTVTGGPVTPPSVTVTAPSDGATIAVNTVQTVTASASFTGGTVTNVQFFANGTAIGSTSTFPYSITWTPTTPGTFAITALATANSGATATSVARTVTAAIGSPPTATIVNPNGGGTYIASKEILFDVTASDPDGTIAQVELLANGVVVATDTNSPYFTNWTPASPGTYTLTARATDNSGNVGVSSAIIITVTQNTPPVINLLSPSSGSIFTVGSDVVFFATATDANGTINNVRFLANGDLIGTADTTAPFTTVWRPGIAGNYTILAIGVDNDLNASTSPPRVITIKEAVGQLPSVTITSPTVGTSLTTISSTKITAGVSDPDGSVLTVSFFDNGTLVGSDSSSPFSVDWIPATAGDHRLVAVAMDNFGNIVSSTSVDLVVTGATSPSAPAVVITTPSSGATLAFGSTINVTANATDTDGSIANVQFFVDGVPLGSADTTFPHSAPFTPSAPGIYVLSARAVDNSGNTTTTPPVTIQIGINVAPTVSISSPLNGQSYGLGNQVLISANASDGDGTVSAVQFFANGVSIGSVSAAPFNVSWRPTAAGNYNITAMATDNTGNAAVSAVASISVVSAGAPVVTISNPVASSSFIAGNTVPIAALASGGNGSVAQVQFFINGVPLSSDTTSPYTATWTPNAPGTYVVLALATDSAGVSSNSTPVNVTITTNAAPTVAITSPASGTGVNAGTLVNLVAAASDADGTVASVRFLANGNLIASLSAVPYIGAWTPTASGVYSIVAQASDNSGNVTNSSPVIVSVLANQSPVVRITSPSNGATVRVGAGVNLAGTATDADGTIASVQFFANGVAVGSPLTTPSSGGGYRTSWTPTAEGIYRLAAVGLDNSGAVTTSTTVVVIGSASGGDAIATGSYQGQSENGNFAVISGMGKTATFIGYSTTAGANKIYYHTGVPVDVLGGFSLLDSSGVSKVSGNASDTGTSGSLDAGRLSFIGIDTRYFPSGTSVPTGFFSGTFTGRPNTVLSAIVGFDGSIMLYAADGTFEDAAGGGLGGRVDSTGAFNVVSLRGNRFIGRADPVTGLVAGTLSGVNGGAFSLGTKVLSAPTNIKVSGAASEVGPDIRYPLPPHNIYDQVLLRGTAATITADPGQITRISFVDLTDSIVQVEFSGAGSLSITLDNASGPAPAVNYNQPDVSYMKGHAGIIITGADETTNVSIFSVGKITALNQGLFKSGATYDGIADVGYLTILTANGKFGGVRAANANFFATTGFTGICAPGVQFTGPVYVGDISAAHSASPMLLVGSAPDAQITGGDLLQANGQPVQISGLTSLKFSDGTTSQGGFLAAQPNRARLQQNGADVAAQVASEPTP